MYIKYVRRSELDNYDVSVSPSFSLSSFTAEHMYLISGWGRAFRARNILKIYLE